MVTTHHCRSPTPKLNDCELTTSTETQSSDQEYSYLTTSKRHPSTLYSHFPQHPPKLFTRNPAAYFPEVDKHVYTSLACSQDFSKICWRVEICSVLLRPRRKPHGVSSVPSPWGPYPPNKAPRPRIETWNIINQLSFCQFLECQAPPAQTESPPAETQRPHIENFLATVLGIIQLWFNFFTGSWHTLFLGDYVKRCRGSSFFF